MTDVEFKDTEKLISEIEGRLDKIGNKPFVYLEIGKSEVAVVRNASSIDLMQFILSLLEGEPSIDLERFFELIKNASEVPKNDR